MEKEILDNLINPFLLVYAALFPIVNPLGSAPVFLSFTRHCSAPIRHALAWRIGFNGFLLLLGSLFIGSHILSFFGITLPVVRIAGGFVVTAMGWKILNEGDQPKEGQGFSSITDEGYVEAAFYPLTMPLTVGPGSIAAAVTLGSQRPRIFQSFAHLALIGSAAIVGLVAIAATIVICYRFAENIERMLGRTGTNVFVRLSAFVLLCIGVQIMWNGYSGLIVPPID
ncbi:MAG TPA: MarC family protein [Alphaproteobacteria bacterium]|nr:MarC family protein [Alphaproteobacteria bacterium]